MKPKKTLFIFYFSFIILVVISLLPLLSASLGTFKQNECVNIVKTMVNATSANVSTITNPDSIVVVNNQVMSKNGAAFNYTYCNTEIIGNYNYELFDNDRIVYENNFEITPSGIANTLSFYIILFGISLFLMVLGFSIKDGWVTILGTFGLYFMGLYILINGIVGIKDTTTTYAIAIILLGAAAYISVASANEMIGGE